MLERARRDAEDPREPELGLGQLFVLLLYSPVFQVIGAVVAAVVIGGGLYASQLYTGAVSDTCEELPKADLEVSEMVAVKDRFDDYKRHPLPEATLGLTGLEFNFATRSRAYGFTSYAEFFDDKTTMRAAVPRDDGRCYNILFHGTFEIQDGVAILHPETLTVGDSDITGWVNWWFGDAGMPLRPQQLPDETSAAHLANVQSMKVEGSMAIIQLRDRWGMW